MAVVLEHRQSKATALGRQRLKIVLTLKDLIYNINTIIALMVLRGRSVAAVSYSLVFIRLLSLYSELLALIF